MKNFEKWPRIVASIHPDTELCIKAAAKAADVSVSRLIDRLLGAHVQELDEFIKWMDKTQDEELRKRGAHALTSYGPNDLITELRNIDPAYTGPAALQMSAGAHLLTLEEVAEVRAFLAERKGQ